MIIATITEAQWGHQVEAGTLRLRGHRVKEALLGHRVKEDNLGHRGHRVKEDNLDHRALLYKAKNGPHL